MKIKLILICLSFAILSACSTYQPRQEVVAAIQSTEPALLACYNKGSAIKNLEDLQILANFRMTSFRYIEDISVKSSGTMSEEDKACFEVALSKMIVPKFPHHINYYYFKDFSFNFFLKKPDAAEKQQTTIQ